LTDWVIAFIDQVVALKGPAAEPIIYTTSTYTAQLDARVADYDLWIRSNFGDPQTGTASPSSTRTSFTTSRRRCNRW
jgi:GH25 family lysozyme M1 (1,4-beta-N-acetylmuramidase)